MPPQPKTEDVVYSWIDEFGKTHYSNYKVSTDVAAPPATHLPTPVTKLANNRTLAQHQSYTPMPIKLIHTNSGLSVIIVVLLLLLLAMIIIFKLLFERSGCKKKAGCRSNLPPKNENNKNIYSSSAPKNSQEVSTPPDHSRYMPMPQPVICELEESSPEPSWNLDFIQRLDWREFEKLCARILQENGYRAELGDIGPDGGLDLHIYKQDEPERLIGIAQCKRQNQPIKIDTVRAFRWVMTSKQVDKGFFFTSGTFYKQARQFCEEENIEVITGDKLLIAINKLSIETQTEILDAILATDYMSHICVNCGIKMVKRANKKTNEEFWGCINYPVCKNKIGIRKRDHNKDMVMT
jgi:restriction system protein